MHHFLLSLLLLTIAMQPGCAQLAEIDTSHALRYQAMIGREFMLKEELKVKGVKRDLRSKQPDYAKLIGTPGIGGPEFFELGSKPAGSRFTIVGVIIRKSELFPETTYVVRFADGLAIAPGITDLRISDGNGFRFHTKPLTPEDAPQLNERYFAPVASR